MYKHIEVIDEVVGETPVVRLQRVGGGAVRLKLETRSPNATVMDRVARHLVKRAGAGVWREAGDGARAVAVAMQGALHRRPVEVWLPEDVPLEVRQTLMTYGAHVTLTPFALGPAGARAAAGETLSDRFPDAFKEAMEEIGRELRASEERIDAFIGPAQTFSDVKVIGVRPAAAPHRQHGLLEGEGEVEVVDDRAAWAMRGRLGREEGLLVSAATAAHVEAACRVAAKLGPYARVYALAFDTGERSFSTADQLAAP